MIHNPPHTHTLPAHTQPSPHTHTPHPQANYFTPAAHADIIYQHYLFDVPKLMDLCVLYGNSNKTLLSKLVANVFKWQPQYKQDWSMAVRSFAKVSQFD